MTRAHLRAFHHTQLAIPPDVEDVCRAFWSGVLGCEEIDKPPELARRGGCWFRAGSLEVHLGVDDDFRPSAKAHPGIVVADIRGLARRLAEHGVPVAWDSSFPGFERFYCADPFGNRLEFLEPVGERDLDRAT
jgi:catechol 2,3-dioxygenase-like lactoylglutathione lyase family enzyme